MKVSAIDKAAGTHFSADKIFVTPHACDEAAKDFGVSRDRAPQFVMAQLRKATFIDNVIGDDGNPGRLFGYQRMAIVVAPDVPTVITVYPRHVPSSAIRDPIEKVLYRALTAAKRKEAREIKRINVEIAQLGIERAQCSLRKAKSSSRKVCAVMDVRIAEIDAALRNYAQELYEVRREKSNLAKGIVAYV
jgi:hypothetical protein